MTSIASDERPPGGTACARRDLTVREVAERFGVVPQTIVRWADEEILPCTRTAGGRRGRGHRRFRMADVEALAAQLAGQTCVRRACGDPDRPGAPDKEDGH